MSKNLFNNRCIVAADTSGINMPGPSPRSSLRSQRIRKWFHPARALAGTLLVLAAAASCLLPDQLKVMTVVSCVLGAMALVAILQFSSQSLAITRGQMILAAAALVARLSAGVVLPYALWVTSVLLWTALGLWLGIPSLRRLIHRIRRKPLRVTVRTLVVTFGSIILLAVAVFELTAIAPGPVVTPMAALSIGSTENRTTAEERVTTRADGSVLHENVRYGETYPNSFLDVYTRHEDAPTFFYLHGGAFVGGDKAEGDPFAPDGGADDFYYQSLLDAGYNVVSANYTLAPDYIYPTPIIQLAGALKFLADNASTYGLDMGQVIIAGSSAGGQLAGQLVNVQTNPAYAREMSITQPLKPEAVKAAVFASSLLDPARFAETGEVIVGYGWYQYGRQYFNTGFLQDSPQVAQANVITHATPEFPPTYISDGNSTSFFEQAIRMGSRLSRLGVQYELHIVDRREEKVTHGFESVGDEVGRDNMERMLDFLHGVVPGAIS